MNEEKLNINDSLLISGGYNEGIHKW